MVAPTLGSGDPPWQQGMRTYPKSGTPLSPREIEVIRLRGKGLKNLAVAFELGIAEQTVKNHVTSALRRTGSANMTELAARLARWEMGARDELEEADPLMLLERRVAVLEERVFNGGPRAGRS